MKTKLNAYPFLYNLDLDADVLQRLSLYLDRLKLGNDIVYTSPLGADGKANVIRDELDSIFKTNKHLINDTLYAMELSNREKFGSRSTAKTWFERKENLLESFGNDPLVSRNSDMTYPPPTNNLRPIDMSSALKILKNNTNSGLPYFTRKSKIKERILKDYDYLIKRKDPCILFTRTQEGNKTRDVWGYPAADTLNEMRFYVPILDYQRRQSWRSALNGPDAVDNRLTYIIQQARLNNLILISIDFSAYDRSLKQGLQRIVGEYYKCLFQTKYHEEIDYIIERKSTIGLVTPDGIFRGPNAEPSGSTLTNEDDSICQYLIARLSGCLVDDLFDIQGDDGVYAIEPTKVKDFLSTFRRFGFEVNEDKSYQSDKHLIYLQNLHHPDYVNSGNYVGIYPTYRALNRILYQERWSNFEDFNISGSDYYSIRTICILENCKHHPLFEKLVSFVLKYDKYKLQLSQKGLSNYVKMISDTQGSEGILINQYGDNIGGLANFQTVKLIRRLV